jgi:hypothetical protein
VTGTIPHDSHRAIAQLGSRAKVEADHNLDGGGAGPGSSDNLTLDLVSAAAANAPSLIKKMTRGRYRLLCLLMAHSGQSNRTRVCPLSDQSGQRWILARDALSANDPKRTSGPHD